MSTLHLHPFAGDHAIQNVAFAIEWTQSLTNEQLQSIKSIHSQLLPFFEKVAEAKAITINLSAANDLAPIASNSSDLGGIQFIGKLMSFPPGQPSQLIQASRENCSIIINDYSRWNQVWENVEKWINLIKNSIPSIGVKSVSLQYTDALHWRNDPKLLNISDVFSKNTVYLPSHVFSSRSLWHVHQGFFSDESIIGSNRRLLENINISHVENNSQRTFIIVTSHKAILDSPIWDSGEFSMTIKEIMPILHNRNKNILTNILSEEVCSKINLKSSEAKL